MNKQQQIEEMAKVIDDRLIEARGWLGSMNRGKGYWIAQKLVENYQPKLPEDSVVLSREERQARDYECYNLGYEVAHKEMLKDCIESNKKAKQIGYEKGSKETAKEILQLLYSYPHEYHEKKIIEIAKQYGVEVEE